MKGLLLKDLFSVRHYALWYAVVTVACFIVSVFTENVSFMFGLQLFITMSSSMVTISADEKDSWTKYALSCGLTARTIVASKYIIAIAAALVTCGFSIAASALISTEMSANILPLFVFTSVTMFAVAIVIPLAYRFGTEKSRLVFTVCVLLCMVAAIAIGSLLDIGAFSAPLPVYVALPITWVAALVLSWTVSEKIVADKNY